MVWSCGIVQMLCVVFKARVSRCTGRSMWIGCRDLGRLASLVFQFPFIACQIDSLFGCLRDHEMRPEWGVGFMVCWWDQFGWDVMIVSSANSRTYMHMCRRSIILFAQFLVRNYVCGVRFACQTAGSLNCVRRSLRHEIVETTCHSSSEILCTQSRPSGRRCQRPADHVRIHVRWMVDTHSVPCQRLHW